MVKPYFAGMDADEIAKKLAEQSAKDLDLHWQKNQEFVKKYFERSPKEQEADYDKVLELEERRRNRTGLIGNLIFWGLVTLILLAINAIRR